MSMRPGTRVRSGRSITWSAPEAAVRVVGHRGDAVALDDDARAVEHLAEVDVEDALGAQDGDGLIGHVDGSFLTATGRRRLGLDVVEVDRRRAGGRAAVDRDDGAGDLGRPLAGEVDGGVGHVAGAAEALERLDPPDDGRGVEGGVDVGGDVAGGDDVDADAELGDLDGGAAAEVDDAGLGGAVAC